MAKYAVENAKVLCYTFEGTEEEAWEKYDQHVELWKEKHCMSLVTESPVTWKVQRTTKDELIKGNPVWEDRFTYATKKEAEVEASTSNVYYSSRAFRVVEVPGQEIYTVVERKPSYKLVQIGANGNVDTWAIHNSKEFLGTFEECLEELNRRVIDSKNLGFDLAFKVVKNG